jgi:transposase-like protein
MVVQYGTAKGPKRKLKKETIAQAALASGCSLREAARKAGVSAPTVARWRDLYGWGPGVPPSEPPAPGYAGYADPIAARVAAAVPPPPPSAPADDPPAEELDTVASTRELLRQTMAIARQARAEGNLTAAQRAMRDAQALQAILARVEASRASDDGALHLSPRELAEADAVVRDRIAAVVSRPLLCAHCSRALSVQWSAADPAEFVAPGAK